MHLLLDFYWIKQDTLRQVLSIVGFSLNKPVPSICVQDLCYIYMSLNIFKHIYIFVFRRERPPFHIYHEEFKGTPNATLQWGYQPEWSLKVRHSRSIPMLEIY